MPSGTFEERSREVDFVLKEEYRFTFLCYLKIAKVMVELGTEAENVARLQLFLGGGRCCKDNCDESWSEVIKAGDSLFFRYGMDYSLESFNSAAKQLFAELSVTRRQEQRLFKDLLRLTQEINPVKAEGGQAPTSWFFGDAKKHRRLLTMDSLALDRIKYYEAALTKYGERPLLPCGLEMSFRVFHGGLAHLAPL